MPIDRRVARTRNALYDALVTLILRKGYEATTVQDLLDEADVGRATFYSHFTSKDDLLAHSLDRVRAILVDAVATAGNPASARRAWSLALFQHVMGHRSVYFALAGIDAGEVLRTAIRRVIADFVAKRIGPKPSVPTELQALSIASLLMTLLTWWLERRPDLAPEAVDELFGRLLTEPVDLH